MRDWDQFARVHQHGWKERLKISDVTKIKPHKVAKVYRRLHGGGTFVPNTVFRGTQREYTSKALKHSIVKRILVFKR